MRGLLGACRTSTSCMKPNSSPTLPNRPACPLTMCSTRPVRASALSPVPSRNCTTKAHCGESGVYGMPPIGVVARQHQDAAAMVPVLLFVPHGPWTLSSTAPKKYPPQSLRQGKMWGDLGSGGTSLHRAMCDNHWPVPASPRAVAPSTRRTISRGGVPTRFAAR